jgi:anti-sigma B factor antagonist
LGGDHRLVFSHAAATDVSEDEMNLKIEKRQVDGVTVVSCLGRIMFGDEANALRDFLKQTLTESPRMVLNLSGVTYIDSGGLGTLVGVYSSARAAGAEIKLTGLGQRLHDVLQITKLATVFEAFDSEQEALAAIGRGAA